MKEITSLQNSIVKHLVKLRHNRDYRYEQQTVIVDGVKLVNEVCNTTQTKRVLVTCESLIPKNLVCQEILLVKPEIINKITEMPTPEGILAEVVLPKPSSLENRQHLIAFDGISDPGNMGALLRTALALGWQGAFILQDCCDPFNDKAIRAAKGATFRIPFCYGTWKELKSLISLNKLTPLAADIEGTSLNQFRSPEHILLVLGNEAHGLSKEAKELCEKITIPMSGQMESLNVSVAGGILMYTLLKF